LKQQGLAGSAVVQAQQQAQDQAAQEAELDDERELLRVAVDAVSLGRGDEAKGKTPLVRHVIVKDLRKVAARSKVSLPANGLFEGKAPVMLFALFDGQSCAETPGPLAAEWCAKQILPKLLRNLSALPPGYENETFVKATLLKTFEDLDKDILRGQPAIHDGCGGAVALTVGEKLFTAVVGRCDAVLSEAGNPVSLGDKQGRLELPEEQKWMQDKGGVMMQGENGKLLVSSPAGSVAAVSRSLGDRAWKGPEGGIPGAPNLLRPKPQTAVTTISWAERHTCLALSSGPVADAVNPKAVVEVAAEFPQKPRAASGEIATRAAQVNSGAQCTSVMVCFLPKEDKAAQPPPSKKAKKEAESVRLRHIVVKHRDCGQPFDPVRNRPVSRTKEEAELVLRGALRELIQEAKKVKLPANPDKAKLMVLQPTPKYVALCKELSECSTAQKGGGMMGDLGWLGPPELGRFGPAFAETAKALGVGQWSDLAVSEHGIHVLQRIA
jgi:serine/threonine protein phosphatase PrpC